VVQLHQKQVEERRQLQEHKDKLMDEWGFQNEETKRMFEARFLKNKAVKKKKNLTAEEKLQRFLAIKSKRT